MKISVALRGAGATLAVALVGAAVTAQPAAAVHPIQYGPYTPYGTAKSSIAEPPRGFEPFYLQNVGRHGSRAATNDDSSDEVSKLCARAADQHAITALGRAFCADAHDVDQAISEVGYGQLSPTGTRELTGIGERTATDYRDFFTAAAKSDAEIDFVTTSKERTKDSSDAFRAGVEAEQPGLNLQKRTEDDDLLKFDTDLTADAKRELAKVTDSAGVQAAATSVLAGLFGSASTDVSDARAVWDIYAIAPDVGLDLSEYLSPVDARQLAQLKDAEHFYHYGPGLAGDESYRSATDLRNDLFTVIDKREDGGKAMATFRHAHIETVLPLATLLHLPDSGYDKPATTDKPFNFEDFDWRGRENAKMASNLDLAAYRKGKTILITVRYNEEPVELPGCDAVPDHKFFYEESVLKKCWGVKG